MISLDSTKKMRWLLLGLKSGIYILPLILILMIHLGQAGFFSWTTYLQFYLIPILGLILSLVFVLNQESLFTSPKLLQFSFILDAILILILQNASGLQTSVFLFLYIVIIMMSALAADSRSSLVTAAVISLGFSISSLLGPEIKTITYLFQTLLSNVAFFTVAWIAGLLAEQLAAQGLSLKSLQQLNESIVETIPSGLITMNDQFQIISWNPGAAEIFGHNLKENMNVFEFLGVQKLQNENHEWAQGEQRDVVWKTEADNKILSVRILPHSGLENLKLLLIDDVTQLRQLQLRLLHQEKLAAVGGLAAGIAHELGNPLAAVSANIQFLEPKIKIEDETDKKLIENTHKEIARLGRLIGEFKDFAKPEKMPVDSVRLDILLNDVLDQLARDKTLAQNINVVRIINEVPAISGARDKLLQVFINLIVNSCHAVSEVAEPELKIVCVIRAGFVEVRIADNGIGMSAETKIRLFEPFYTTKGRKGTGLGLAISHKILEAHQVKVTVNSEMGKGSEFILQFPVQQIDLNH